MSENQSASDILSKLSAPFSVDAIHFRVGPTLGDKTKAVPLAYIDARDAMQRLDEVVGPENWQRRYPWSDGKRLCCEVGICIGGEWVWKSDGAGDTAVEAEKGCFSDAFKRACVNWGIARYLYDMPNAWVELDAKGKKFKDESELKRRMDAWQTRYFQKEKKQ